MAEKYIKQQVLEDFYWLHRHPELSYEEYETTARLQRQLTAAGIRLLPMDLKTGLVAEVGHGSTVVALRADIDALPIQEETGLEYASEVSGKMHACGHDFHTSALYGAALLLKAQEDKLPGRIRLIFQPAEEAPGGAKMVMATEALQDVQAIFGMHVSPLLPVGTLGLRNGAVTASVDRFQITFQGQGTHAAHPDRGLDPVPVLASFIQAAQTVVSRRLDPFAAGIVSITHVEAGNTWNVLPDTALAEGTTRSLSASDRKLIKESLLQLADSLAKAHGMTTRVEWYDGPPSTDNQLEWIEQARQVAEASGYKIVESPASMAGEDFAYYQEKVPGAFVQMGTGLSYSNHNPKFKVDPEALWPAVQYLAALGRQALQHLQLEQIGGKPVHPEQGRS